MLYYQEHTLKYQLKKTSSSSSSSPSHWGAVNGAVHDGFPSIGRQSTARSPPIPWGQRYLETMWYHNNFIHHCAQKKLLQCQFGSVARARVSVFHKCAAAICSKTRLASHPAADSPRLSISRQARQKEGRIHLC